MSVPRTSGGLLGGMAVGLAGGLLLAASLPPWPIATGAWLLALVGAALLFASLNGRGWRGRLAVGVAAGVGLYAPGLWWMRDFSASGYVVATLLEAAILAAAMVAVPSVPGGWRRACAFPAALVAAEALRGAWPFGGLPLAGIDLGQVGGPLGPAAVLGGRLLLVALVGVAGVGLTGLAAQRWRAAGAAIAVVAVLAGAGAAVAGAAGGPTAGRLSVAAVQGGGPRGLRAVETDEGDVLQAHLAASERVRPSVGLVLWPEDVIDVPALAGSEPDAQMAALARRLGAPVVAGVVEDVDSTRFHNAAVVWAPDGRRTDRYEKVHRVPFGEYVPARRLFERLTDLSAVPRDAVAGVGPGVLDTTAGRMGVLISYEVFFADRARAAVRAGGQVLLVPTNASSYRDAQVPAQELAAARLRALETGRWVVQAAPTGYSAVVDPRGRVHERSRLGTREVLTATVQRRTGRTLAVRLGTLWPTAIAVTVLGLANVSEMRRL